MLSQGITKRIPGERLPSWFSEGRHGFHSRKGIKAAWFGKLDGAAKRIAHTHPPERASYAGL